MPSTAGLEGSSFFLPIRPRPSAAKVACTSLVRPALLRYCSTVIVLPDSFFVVILLPYLLPLRSADVPKLFYRSISLRSNRLRILQRQKTCHHCMQHIVRVA